MPTMATLTPEGEEILFAADVEATKRNPFRSWPVTMLPDFFRRSIARRFIPVRQQRVENSSPSTLQAQLPPIR